MQQLYQFMLAQNGSKMHVVLISGTPLSEVVSLLHCLTLHSHRVLPGDLDFGNTISDLRTKGGHAVTVIHNAQARSELIRSADAGAPGLHFPHASA